MAFEHDPHELGLSRVLALVIVGAVYCVAYALLSPRLDAASRPLQFACAYCGAFELECDCLGPLDALDGDFAADTFIDDNGGVWLSTEQGWVLQPGTKGEVSTTAEMGRSLPGTDGAD